MNGISDLMNGISDLIKEIPRDSLSLSIMRGHSEKVLAMNQEEGPYSTMLAPRPWLPAPRTQR